MRPCQRSDFCAPLWRRKQGECQRQCTPTKFDRSVVLPPTGTLLAGFSMGCWPDLPAVWIGPALGTPSACRIHRGWRAHLLVLAACLAAFIPRHANMAVFRTIENGACLVRQTDQGMSIALDPYGRLLGQTDVFGWKDRTMVARVSSRHVPTHYTASERLLGWL